MKENMKPDKNKKYLRIGSHQVEPFYGDTYAFMYALKRIKNRTIKLAREFI